MGLNKCWWLPFVAVINNLLLDHELNHSGTTWLTLCFKRKKKWNGIVEYKLVCRLVISNNEGLYKAANRVSAIIYFLLMKGFCLLVISYGSRPEVNKKSLVSGTIKILIRYICHIIFFRIGEMTTTLMHTLWHMLDWPHRNCIDKSTNKTGKKKSCRSVNIKLDCCQGGEV